MRGPGQLREISPCWVHINRRILVRRLGTLMTAIVLALVVMPAGIASATSAEIDLSIDGCLDVGGDQTATLRLDVTNLTAETHVVYVDFKNRSRGTFAAPWYSLQNVQTAAGATSSISFIVPLATLPAENYRYWIVKAWFDEQGVTANRIFHEPYAYVPPCPTNEPPKADPNGPYSVAVSEVFTVDGTGSSDPDDDLISYGWSFEGSNQSGATVNYVAPPTAGTYTVALTVDDGNGGTDTAYTDVVVNEPALKERKQAVADDLSAVGSTGNDKDDKKLKKARDHLTKSLDEAYWEDDGDTLDAKDGKKVFDEESKAVKDLSKIKSTAVSEDVSDAIAALVAIDKELAQGAINDAQDRYDTICTDPTTKECKKAAKELANAAKEMLKADEELDKGHSDRAIGKYKKAWGKAQKALKALPEFLTGSIVIVKETNPAGGLGFGFTHDIPPPDAFSLDDGQTMSFLDVVPGTYTVTESDPSPLTLLTALTCDDGGSTTPSTTSVGTRAATIEVDPGETVTCTWTNTATPPADTVIGSITADITRTRNAAGESALGDVIADSLLAGTYGVGTGKAVAAFMNPDSIRDSLWVSEISGSELPGEITFGEAFDVLPYGNSLVTMTLTGTQIDTLLEQQFDNPVVGSNRILQVSQGFTYEWNSSATTGNKVALASIKIDGVPIVGVGEYRVTVTNFMAAGGEGFTVLVDGTDRLVGVSDLGAFGEYFDLNSPPGVDPGPQNRITRIP